MAKPPEKPNLPPPPVKAGIASPPSPAMELKLERGNSGLGVIPPKSTHRAKTERRLDKQARLEKTIKIDGSEGGGLGKFFFFILLSVGGLYGAEQMGFDTLSAIESIAQKTGIKLPMAEEITLKPQVEFKIAKKVVAAAQQPVDVPNFAFGDEFVFSHEAVNGKGVEVASQELRYSVVGMLGERVRWNVSEQMNLISSRNPFLGDLEEVLLYRESGRSPSSVAFVGEGMELFPLVQGGKLELARGGAPGEGYNCSVGAREKLSVKAGEFETIRVECKTVGGARSREEVFNYAPSVGYWVARRTLYKNGEFQRTDTYQLVSFSRAK